MGRRKREAWQEEANFDLARQMRIMQAHKRTAERMARERKRREFWGMITLLAGMLVTMAAITTAIIQAFQ